MKIAQVSDFSQNPKHVEVEDPPAPSSESDLIQVRLAAVGVHRKVRARASGKHYSAKGLPHIPGVDGVGTTVDGDPVYFTTFTPHGGSFAEIINVLKSVVSPLP